jgi:hypothetical protein
MNAGDTGHPKLESIMTLALRTTVAGLATVVLLVACSSGPSSGGPPAASSSAPATGAAPASAAAAGEPCSYLTAQDVGAILGATPVEVAERVGRGDCDYWLTLTRDGKVNIGVFTGNEAATYFESTKRIGTPEPLNLGDEAYSIFNESIGTVVVARKGDAVVAAQVYVGDVPADQLRQATALVQAVLARL